MTRPDDPAAAAAARLRSEHASLLAGVGDCADRVAATWPPGGTTDRGAVVEPFRACLRERGLLARTPAAVAGMVDAAGFALPARPVPGPPYVAVTGEGLVLRATVDAGRLVATLGVFAVQRGEETRYVRATGGPLSVAFV